MKKVAVINDLSGFGKCSLTAAIPVLSALDTQCCPLPTAVLTGQTGYAHYYCTDLTDMIPQYIDAWKKQGESFDGIYTGYTTGMNQIRWIMQFLDTFCEENTFLLVDPVMGDDGHVYHMFTEELLPGMRELTQKAHLITPNLTEACLLCGLSVDQQFRCTGEQELLEFAFSLAHKLHARAHVNQDVVITGIKCHTKKEDEICNVIVTPEGESVCRSVYFNQSFSGTGDLFASVLCGCKVNGWKTKDAVTLACDFLCQSIKDTMPDYKDRNDGIHFEPHLSILMTQMNQR